MQVYHASSLDNSNRLEDGGAAALSPAFLENKQCMDGVVRHLHELVGQALLGGGQKSIDRHKSRGKMLPRDRITSLLDPGSPFLELSQLAGHQLYGIGRWRICCEWTHHTKSQCNKCYSAGKEEVPAGGLVTGIGQVHGRAVAIVANDATG